MTNILANIPLAPITSFSMKIGRIEAGWMDICISLNEKKFDYTVSYVCNPLEDLLYKFLWVIGYKPVPIVEDRYIDGYLKNGYAIIEHDLEGDNVVYLLHYRNKSLKIYIWHYIYVDLLLDLCYYDFNEKEYYRHTFEELPKDLNENLLWAMEGEPAYFGNLLKQIFDDLKNKYPFADVNKTKDWGKSFSKVNYRILLGYLYEQGLR